MITTLYLHGFLSSPDSYKGRLLAQAHAEAGIDFVAPVLHTGPRDASKIILEAIDSIKTDRFCVIGSSLGGFYATWVAEKFGVPAVLLNPAVRPWLFMQDKIGEHYITGTDKKITVYPEYWDELVEMAHDAITQAHRYLTILGDADEVLNWQDGRDFYQETDQLIVAGGDHRLSHFETILPRIMDFIVAQSA